MAVIPHRTRAIAFNTTRVKVALYERLVANGIIRRECTAVFAREQLRMFISSPKQLNADCGPSSSSYTARPCERTARHSEAESNCTPLLSNDFSNILLNQRCLYVGRSAQTEKKTKHTQKKNTLTSSVLLGLEIIWGNYKMELFLPRTFRADTALSFSPHKQLAAQ